MDVTSHTFTSEQFGRDVIVILCINNKSFDQAIGEIKGCKGILGCAGMWTDKGNNHIKLVSHDSIKDILFEHLKRKGFRDCGLSKPTLENSDYIQMN